MKNKRILLIFSILMSFACIPTSNASYVIPEGHFLVGLELGQTNRSGKLNADYYALNPAPGGVPAFAGGQLVNSTINKISDSGTFYGGLAGFQWLCRDFVFGIEGHMDFGRNEKPKFYHFASQNNVNQFLGQARYVRHTTVGLTARLGITLFDFVTPYLRGGAEYSKDELQRSEVINPAGAGYIGYDQYTAKKDIVRYLVGGGFEIPFFSDRSKLRAEYLYSPGRHVRFTDPDDVLFVVQDYRPREHSGKLQWVFHFNPIGPF